MNKRWLKLKPFITPGNLITSVFLFVLLTIFLLICHTGLIDHLEYTIYDLKVCTAVKVSKDLTPSEDIILVALDEWSTTELDSIDVDFKRWPWPRDNIAQILDFINEGKPRAILYHFRMDIAQEGDKDKKIIESIKKIDHFYPIMDTYAFRSSYIKAIVNNLASNPDIDPVKKYNLSANRYKYLIKKGGLEELAKYLHFSRLHKMNITPIPEKLGINVETVNLTEDSPLINNITFLKHSNIPEPFEKIYKTITAFFYAKDKDNVLRYEIPLVRHELNKIFIPSMAFAVYKDFYGDGKVVLTENYVETANKKIPVNSKGRMALNFNNNFDSYKSVPILKTVLTYQHEKGLFKYPDFENSEYYVDKTIFKDKFVIMGSMDGQHSVPGKKVFANIEVVATALDNYINCGPGQKVRFIKDIPPYLTWIITIIFAILTSLLLLKYDNIYIKIGLIFIGVLFYFLLAFYLYTMPHIRLNLPVVTPVFLIFFTSLCTFFWQYQTIYRKRREIESLFGKFISPQVKQTLMNDPSLINYEGHKKEMTVMFTDLRGFTSISESSPINQITAQLNEYFTAMAKVIIYEYNGTLDKYMGDAIMAFWGDPLPQDNHAELAVRAAFRMQERLDELNIDWAKKGWPILKMGIGINTGEMIAGHLGGEILIDYTVIGDNVNIASRLEALNKEFGTSIIISEATYNYCKNIIEAAKMGEKFVKGKSSAVRIYSAKKLLH
jgi:adenylate cyclase